MTDDDLRRAVLAQVAGLRLGTTCCPSKIARDLADDWRPLMDPLRQQAMRLQDRGLLRITQGGVAVTGPDIRGPIRLGPAPTRKDSDV